MNKKIVSAALLLAICLTFGGCGDESVPAGITVITSAAPDETAAPDNGGTSEEVPSETSSAADIVNEIMTETAMTSMAEVTSDRMGNYIEADMDKVESFSMYICGSGAFADEAAVFVMVSEDDTAAMEDALKKRAETKLNDYKDYKPEECYKIEEAVIKSNGKYVLFAVSSDNDKAEDIFDDKLS